MNRLLIIVVSLFIVLFVIDWDVLMNIVLKPFCT